MGRFLASYISEGRCIMSVGDPSRVTSVGPSKVVNEEWVVGSNPRVGGWAFRPYSISIHFFRHLFIYFCKRKITTK